MRTKPLKNAISSLTNATNVLTAGEVAASMKLSPSGAEVVVTGPHAEYDASRLVDLINEDLNDEENGQMPPDARVKRAQQGSGFVVTVTARDAHAARDALARLVDQALDYADND